MKFGAPEYIWLVLIIPFLIIFFRGVASSRRRREQLFAQESLYLRLTEQISSSRRLIKNTFFLGAIVFLVLSLLQPRWGYHWEDLTRQGTDLVVAVDTSRSMLADDIKPSRLSRTRRELEDLVGMATGDRIGLVAFAGRPFVLCPLTHDYGALRMFIHDLSVETIPRGGTNLEAALDKSLSLLGDKNHNSKSILLITDGESLEGDWEKAVARAREQEVKIFTIGIGDPAGTPIKVKTPNGEGYLKDREGNIVVSRLDEQILKKIALETGGAYHRATPTGKELDLIYLDRISGLAKHKVSSRRKKVYEERYQFPLALALALIILEVLWSEKKQPGWSRIWKKGEKK